MLPTDEPPERPQAQSSGMLRNFTPFSLQTSRGAPSSGLPPLGTPPSSAGPVSNDPSALCIVHFIPLNQPDQPSSSQPPRLLDCCPSPSDCAHRVSDAATRVSECATKLCQEAILPCCQNEPQTLADVSTPPAAPQQPAPEAPRTAQRHTPSSSRLLRGCFCSRPCVIGE
jgi:hypothetical protein